MIEKRGSSKFGSSVLLENRYVVLEEVLTFLRSKHIEWQSLLETLRKASDGNLEFDFGDVTIQFTRGFGVWSEDRDVIQLSVILQKDLLEKSVTYEYRFEELESLERIMQLRGMDLGER